jgi:hypothetical protein
MPVESESPEDATDGKRAAAAKIINKIANTLFIIPTFIAALIH